MKNETNIQSKLIEKFANDQDLIKQLIIQDLESDDSLLMKRLGHSGKQPNSKATATKTQAKATNQTTADLPFKRSKLDEDELSVGITHIKKAAKALKKAGQTVPTTGYTAWVDGVAYKPDELYTAAFENAGYVVDWKVHTYRSNTFLEHHGVELTQA